MSTCIKIIPIPSPTRFFEKSTIWSIFGRFFALVDFSLGTQLDFFGAEIFKTKISTLRGLRECILIPKTFSKVLQKFWGSQSNPSSNTELFGRFFKCWSIFQKSTNSQKTKIDQKSTNGLHFLESIFKNSYFRIAGSGRTSSYPQYVQHVFSEILGKLVKS